MSVAKKIAVFVAVALAANVLTVALLPRAINFVVLYKIASSGGTNVALPAPRATAEARGIVRPSPDLLYTACVFDVSEKPLHITAPVQDSYVSVAGFAADTSNFFSVNDSQVEPGADGVKRFDMVIARQAGVVAAGAKLVIAPSDRGLILFRSLVPREQDEARVKEFQKQQRCETFLVTAGQGQVSPNR